MRYQVTQQVPNAIKCMTHMALEKSGQHVFKKNKDGIRYQETRCQTLDISSAASPEDIIFKTYVSLQYKGSNKLL